MTSARIRPAIARAATTSVAVVLGLTLSACGGDDSSESSDTPPANNSAESQDEQPDSDSDSDAGSGSGDTDRPDNLSDFPLPDDYTVVTSGSRGGAWTAVLKVPADWAEIRDLYKDGLASTGWTIAGSHPVRDENSIQYDATKDDMEATVAISSVDGATDLMINVVKD